MNIATQPDLPDGWDRLAATHGTFYHRSAWLRTLAQYFGFPLHYCIATDAGAVVGGLPLAEVPALLGPRRFVSLPFSYATGPMATRTELAPMLLTAAVGLATARRIRRVEIKSIGTVSDPVPPFSRVVHYSTYRVPTEGGEGALWARLHPGSTQRSIRKGEKAGVAVESADSGSAWALMADLQDATSHRLGLPAPPRAFFVEGCRRLQSEGLADLYLARLPGGDTAAGIVVWKGTREWIYAFGASRQETLEHRPNHVLIWRAMRDAAAAGVVFDLGRAAPEQTGLVEFKRRWGGEPVPLAYDYWPTAAGINVAKRDMGTLALAGRVWSRLPATLARRGSFLYRYLG
jgi:GNAT acetyltransferase-like protein